MEFSGNIDNGKRNREIHIWWCSGCCMYFGLWLSKDQSPWDLIRKQPILRIPVLLLLNTFLHIDHDCFLCVASLNSAVFF